MPGRLRTRWNAGLCLAAMLALWADSASALSFTLDVEFDEGLAGSFADVRVVEDGNGLLFEIELLGDLGPDADMHRFYFNLAGDFPDLVLHSDDEVDTAYVLSTAPPVAGGAGSEFDLGVSFGNGAGRRGNGVLQTATFRVAPADPELNLGLHAFLDADASTASGGSVLALAALHVQGTSLVDGASSETVGGTLPEPSTGLLLCCGVLLAVRGRGHR